MSEEKLNIHQKLVEIRKTIDVFSKDTKGYKYSYVSGSQVLNKIKTKMDELGVLLEPDMGEIQHELQGKNFVVYGDMVYSWVNADDPNDRIDKKWMLFGSQDDVSKAYGSGLTYAERYFLLKYFGVPTDDEDPDTKQSDNKANTKAAKPITSEQRKELVTNINWLVENRGETQEKWIQALGVSELNKLTEPQAKTAIEKVNKWIEQAQKSA